MNIQTFKIFADFLGVHLALPIQKVIAKRNIFVPAFPIAMTLPINYFYFLVPKTSSHTGLDCVKKNRRRIFHAWAPHFKYQNNSFSRSALYFTTLLEFLNNLWGLGTE
jgi:hypothetical protein